VLLKPLALVLLLMPTQVPIVDFLAHLVFRLLQFPLLKPNNLNVVKHQVLSRISLPRALRMAVTGLWSRQGGESGGPKVPPLHSSECLFTYGHLQYSKSTHRLPHLPHLPHLKSVRMKIPLLCQEHGLGLCNNLGSTHVLAFSICVSLQYYMQNYYK